ncbi:MAG: membrane dipeptidase [Firmicutes bacterium]|nr:membrane dipeptidase [Bacillota bacterium]
MKLSAIEEERATRLHKEALVWDSHCDTLLDITAGKRSLGERTSRGHLDLPRLREGGVKVQIFAIYIDSAPYLRRTLEFLSAFYGEASKNRDDMELATTSKEIKEIVARGKLAALLSIEGGEVLEGAPEILPCLYRLGVRALGLTWNHRNELADGVGEARTGGGLTKMGIETVAQMNNLGMVVDVSHLSPAGFWDVLEYSSQPVIASHSNARGVHDHPRNLSDDQIRALSAQGGVMGINFAPHFLGPAGDLNAVLNHIDYIVHLAGIDCVGLGSDYDGIAATPTGLEDVSQLPNISRGLVARGYTDEDIKKILGENFARVFAQVMG